MYKPDTCLNNAIMRNCIHFPNRRTDSKMTFKGDHVTLTSLPQPATEKQPSDVAENQLVMAFFNEYSQFSPDRPILCK